MQHKATVSAIVLSVFIVLSGTAFSQIANLPFKQFIGTYTPLANPVDMGATSSGSYDDSYYDFALPFPVLFNGVLWNTCYPGTNGYVSFGTSTNTLGNIIADQWITYPTGGGAVAAFASDLYLRSPLTYEVLGTAPNRCLVFEYNDTYHYSNPAYSNMDFQIRFYETSGMIEVVYGDWTTDTYYTGGVGVRGETTADFNSRTTNGTTIPWENSIAGATPDLICDWTNTFMPPSGLTYRWGCHIPANSSSIQMVDAGGNSCPYYTIPGPVFVKYTVSYPLEESYDVDVTVHFYRVGDASGFPAYSETFTVTKPSGVLEGTYAVNAPELPEGFYIVEAEFRMLNNCLDYEIDKQKASTAFIYPGSVMCEVWPGDTDTDRRVTYADRKALNKYITDAHLRSEWLYGPARYRIDYAGNPMTYLTWEAQAGIPWKTPEGCHMDTDGNGVVNSFDYIAIKINWMRAHTESAKSMPTGLQPVTFDMGLNYPNPFHPSTSIDYVAPERSKVTLIVTDTYGKVVATLVDGEVESGKHSVTFNGSGLGSGLYFASVQMTGIESNLTFSRTIKMTLAK